jgi:hypothetical protein
LSDAYEALTNLPRSLCQAGLFFGAWFISTTNKGTLLGPHETISASATIIATIAMKATASKSDMSHIVR